MITLAIAPYDPQVTARAVAGFAGLLGGAAFIASVVSDALDTATFPLSVLLFGVAATGAYQVYAPSARARRLGGAILLGIGVVGAAAYLAAIASPEEAPLAYVGWLMFLVCAVAVSAGVLVLGVIARRRELILLGMLPVLYLGAVIVVKLALGWWITDQTLQAIGEWSAAAAIGGGWMILGAVLLRRSLAGGEA